LKPEEPGAPAATTTLAKRKFWHASIVRCVADEGGFLTLAEVKTGFPPHTAEKE